MADVQIDVDREFVEAAAAGSREAFDELVRRYQRRIFNLARALTSNDGDAEDLAQEAFVRAYRAIRRFRGDSTFKTWLYRVATNVIRTHMARQKRRGAFWGPSLDADEPGAPARAISREDVEADVIARDAIDKALAGLPEELRIAVTLRDVHGLGYREIADLLDVPIGTVESRIFRGRQRLRPLLAPLLGRTATTTSGASQGVGHRAGPPLLEAKSC